MLNTMSDEEETLCRINITPYHEALDRTMPASLSSYMSNSEWVSFCEELDEEREALRSFYKRINCRYRVLLAIALSGGSATCIPFMIIGETCGRWRGWFEDNMEELLNLHCVVGNQSSKSSALFFYLKYESVDDVWIECSTTKRNTTDYFRVEVSRQDGMVDRSTMPALLRVAHTSNTEWMNLCNDIDKIVKASKTMARRQWYMYSLTLLFFSSLLGILMLGFPSLSIITVAILLVIIRTVAYDFNKGKELQRVIKKFNRKVFHMKGSTQTKIKLVKLHWDHIIFTIMQSIDEVPFDTTDTDDGTTNSSIPLAPFQKKQSMLDDMQKDIESQISTTSLLKGSF